MTLANTGSADLSITSIAVSGSNASNFAQTNNCGSTVAASANCTISVTFTPSRTGSRSASITITDGAAGSPHTVALSGTGTTTVASHRLHPNQRLWINSGGRVKLHNQRNVRAHIGGYPQRIDHDC